MILIHAKEIRRFINGPRMSHILRQNVENWNQICSSLDVIEDTEEAIRAFDPTPTNRQVLREDMGKRYLALYGVLQAMFLQQDAVFHLCESLSTAHELSQYPLLDDIRDVRNASIGHPTKRTKQKKRSHHFLSRISMNHPNDIRLLSFYPDGSMKVEGIDLTDLTGRQTCNIECILAGIVSILRQRIEDHKAKFMNDKFADVFPSTLDHNFEKLFEALRRPDRFDQGLWAVQDVEQIMANFRAALQRQDMDVDTFDSVELLFDELAYPIAELRKHLEGQPSDIQSVRMAKIVGFYMRVKADELKQTTVDLDSDEDDDGY